MDNFENNLWETLKVYKMQLVGNVPDLSSIIYRIRLTGWKKVFPNGFVLICIFFSLKKIAALFARTLSFCFLFFLANIPFIVCFFYGP